MTLKERTAFISLVASLLLAAAKLAIGLAIGSLALITDALHSCVDFLATAITWIAVRVGDRPPDASHPYGHGKFENVAALGEAALLLLLAGGVLVEASGRLSAGAPAPMFSLIAVAVLIVEIVVNAWRSRALRRVGRAVAEPDREPGNAGGKKIDTGVDRIGEQRKAAGQEADDQFCRGEDEARDKRDGGGPFLQGHGRADRLSSCKVQTWKALLCSAWPCLA